MASSSSSGLTFKLHPLVILNISDHYTRVKSHSQTPQNGAESTTTSPPPRVFGCVIGVQRGRTVEILNSFELLYYPSSHSLDRSFLGKKQELYKKVFPNYYILGWYSTGSEAEESDMQIHKAKDLPATIYESGTQSVLLQYVLKVVLVSDAMWSSSYPCQLFICKPSFNNSFIESTDCQRVLHVIEGIPQLIFVRSSYTIETVDAERISVDHVAHLKPSDGGSAATQLAAHLTGIHSAVKMLNSRIRVLHHYLLAMQKVVSNGAGYIVTRLDFVPHSEKILEVDYKLGIWLGGKDVVWCGSTLCPDRAMAAPIRMEVLNAGYVRGCFQMRIIKVRPFVEGRNEPVEDRKILGEGLVCAEENAKLEKLFCMDKYLAIDGLREELRVNTSHVLRTKTM